MAKRKQTKQGGRKQAKKQKTMKTKKPIKKPVIVAKSKVKLSKAMSKAVANVAARVHNKGVASGVIHKNYTLYHQVNVQGANTQNVINYAQKLTGNPAPYLPEACGFEPFAVRKLLDAVSVLYNGKAQSFNYNTTTDNFPAKGLKVNFLHCSSTIEMTNDTKEPYDYTVYKCRPRTNTNVPMPEAWSTALNQEKWEGANPTRTTLGVTPGMAEQLNEVYKIEAEHFTLLPGEKKKWYETWKGVVEFEDEIDTTSIVDPPPLYAHSRKIGHAYVIVAKARLKEQNKGGENGVGVGRFNKESAARSFLFEIKETYVVQVPEVASEAQSTNKRIFQSYYDGLDTGGSAAFANTQWNQLSNPVEKLNL